jgi:plasmid stabilization system protein ParE
MAKTPQYNVIVSDRARHMLGVHICFLAKVSAGAARRTKTGILKAVRSLDEKPERFPFLEAEYILPNKYHKMVAESRYLILYQVKDRTVYVDHIVDARQDYEWLIK